MNNNTTMNGNEKIAARNIKRAFNWIIGGYYNCMQDGCEDEIPSLKDVKDEVYNSALTDLYSGGGMVAYGAAPKEMRFAGEAFCRAYIDKLFSKGDSDVEELWGDELHNNNTKNTEEDEKMAKKSTKGTKDTKVITKEELRAKITKDYSVKDMKACLKAAGVKGMSKAKKEDLIEAMLELGDQLLQHKADKPADGTKMDVKMYAFTGMFIGDFTGEVINGELIVNTVSKGELRFDLNTGKEITPDFKARYANRIERA